MCAIRSSLALPQPYVNNCSARGSENFSVINDSVLIYTPHHWSIKLEVCRARERNMQVHFKTILRGDGGGKMWHVNRKRLN